VRLFVEYQYSESFQFFSLFKRYDLGIERVTEISAIQYQDYLKMNNQSKFLPFPKLIIFELVDNACEYPKYYIRIYERKNLDMKIQPSLAYFYVEGSYTNVDGDEIDT
jgi:hypothetical protein